MDSTERIAWQVSGMISEDGYLSNTRLRDSVFSFAKKMRLSADRRVLLWNLVEPQSAEDFATTHREAAGSLDHFVRIATPEDALGFVKKYGPVGLCHHGLPAAHNQGTGVEQTERWAKVEHVLPCRLMAATAGSFAEDSGWYIDIAKAFKQILTAESKVRDWEQSGYDPLKWLPARSSIEFLPSNGVLLDPPWNLRGDENGQFMAVRLRQGLMVEVNTWFVAAGIHPHIEDEFSKDAVTRKLKMNSLNMPSNAFSAVVIQLANVVSGEARLATCSNCKNPYAPRRVPKSGQRNWCSSPICIREKNRVNQLAATKRRKAKQQ
jgi:hypothetical protein